jgi:GxxExxY protein
VLKELTLRLSFVIDRKAFFLFPRNTRNTLKMAEILFKDESYKIMGACFEVYKSKGCGFSESVYQECLAIEFELQGIPFVSQPAFEMEYKGRKLDQFVRPDFLCYGKIIVELKALERLTDICRAQVLNYLSATNFDLGILVNFGHFPKIEYDRLANDMNRGRRLSIYSGIANRLEDIK